MLEISNIGILTAFAAGLISFLSPCVLPLVPGYVSGLSLCFVLGFSTVFVLLGASATALGQLLLAYRYELSIVAGVIVIAFGLFTLGLLRPVLLQRDFRFHVTIPGGRPISAYVLGLAFAFGWTPCIGPILGAVLTVNAVSGTVTNGVALLAIYSMGLGVPFLAAAVFTGSLMQRIRLVGRVGRVLQLLAGGVMILMGVAMITGDLSAFAYWLLETFPVLGEIG
jgi:cytochrome c-type biogenesis protein